ncbi:DUF5518 domain-containing protein [Halobaculum limi]|uniref:DUF5518 domain-containing protein n=1 Tax=Halobaculum limi TaxID=3031916 RepID=UPI002405A5E3|nr:DUF5518 domain-containing protein [Halobaculum sp. YSMS11]
MSRSSLPSLPLSATWTYALVGGVVSMPLTVGAYWLSGMGSNFSVNLIVVGGLVAGVLAERHDGPDVNAVSAGLRAGIVGGLPGYVWFWSSIREIGTSFATAWSSPVAGAVLMAVAAGFVVAISALPGLIGGAIGGWLVERFTERPAGADPS